MAAKNVLQKHWDGTQWVELHPITKASNVITTVDGRDVEIHLGEKVNKVAGKGLSTNDYTNTDKTKLDGIAAGANNYSHPANHPPSIITQDANNRFVTDSEKSAWNAKQSSLGAGTTTQYLRGDKTWAVPPDTTYSAMPIAEANTGTATTSRTITASVLKSAIRTGAIDVVSSDPASLVAGQVYFLEV